ncbi:hypothetical protein [Streptomyces asiaticus]|uniref:hypothetical protein n=1 Tax=Streptomyces asiaticus TaxID=114695 RepID=UPI003D751AE9
MSGALHLEPRVSPRVSSLLGSSGYLHTLADALGSPLGLVLPDQIGENVERFRSVYSKHHLSAAPASTSWST